MWCGWTWSYLVSNFLILANEKEESQGWSNVKLTLVEACYIHFEMSKMVTAVPGSSLCGLLQWNAHLFLLWLKCFLLLFRSEIGPVVKCWKGLPGVVWSPHAWSISEMCGCGSGSHALVMAHSRSGWWLGLDDLEGLSNLSASMLAITSYSAIWSPGGVTNKPALCPD